MDSLVLKSLKKKGESFANSLPRETAILRSHLSRFQRMLIQNLERTDDPFTEEEAFLFSTVALAKFLNCSLSTGKRLIKKGLIKKHRHGNHVFYVLSEVLKAIDDHPQIAAYLTRSPKPRKPVVPKIYYRCFLSPGECLFVDVRHQGWEASIVCNPDLWGRQEEIENLVHTIVDIRHSIRPFRIATSRPVAAESANCFNQPSKKSA